MLRTRSPSRGRAERGFTLIELMYASGYFSLGLLGLVYFQSNAAFGTQRAGDLSLATNLTRNALESLRVQPVSSVLAVSQPQTLLYDRWGYLNGSPSYFTVTTQASQATGNRFYDVVVNTAWQQVVGDNFIHGISMQSRVATE